MAPDHPRSGASSCSATRPTAIRRPVASAVNSAVHDAHNLCWKLAAGPAGERPATRSSTPTSPSGSPRSRRNIQRSVENALNHLRIVEALGISGEHHARECRRNVRQLWEKGPESDARREPVARVDGDPVDGVQGAQRGVRLPLRVRGRRRRRQRREPVAVDDVRVYQPDTRPGSPLPHAWVERAGTRVPLRQVAPPSSFTLIAGEDGADWCAAAWDAAARRGIELTALRVGHAEGDWLDPRLAFLRVREFGREGAILVRPDRVIAWRSMGAAADPLRELGAAMDSILARAG